MKISQVLELNFAKINKREVQIRSGGREKLPKISKRGTGRSIKHKE